MCGGYPQPITQADLDRIFGQLPEQQPEQQAEADTLLEDIAETREQFDQVNTRRLSKLTAGSDDHIGPSRLAMAH